MVDVYNLTTGEVLTYSSSPEQAVVAAFEQSRGNFNTWDYDFSKAVITTNGRTVYCGDFSAFMKGQECEQI